MASTRVFTRDLIGTHCPGTEWPRMVGGVELGERFAVETERFNRVNGPIAVDGVRAGDAIAVHIEHIAIEPPYESPNGGPFFEGMGDAVPLTYIDGRFHYPNGLTLPARPSIGNIAVLPAPTDTILALSRRDLGPPAERHRGWGWRGIVNDLRGRHCHQDCAYLAPGSTLHIKAQVDGAGLCFGDVHGYIGQGEVAFAAIEVAACLEVRVQRSQGWYVDWPLIETEDEIMVFASDTNALTGTRDEQYVDVVRRAYQEMRKVVAHRIGGTISDANPIVAAALDIRNCALYGLGNYIQPSGKDPNASDGDLALVGALPRSVFADTAGAS